MSSEVETERKPRANALKAKGEALVPLLALGDRVMCVPKASEPSNQFVAMVIASMPAGFTLVVFHGGGRTWPQYEVSPRPNEQRGKHGSYWLPLASGLR